MELAPDRYRYVLERPILEPPGARVGLAVPDFTRSQPNRTCSSSNRDSPRLLGQLQQKRQAPHTTRGRPR
jgi:hypothetical protein